MKTIAITQNHLGAAAAVALFMLIALSASMAMAKPYGKHEEERYSWESDRGRHDERDSREIKWRGARDVDSDRVIITIPQRDRAVIISYVREDWRTRNCPPGLSKKHDGCVPPGHAKHYAVGQMLPADVVVVEPPHDMIVLLGAPPRGTRYVQVDEDILLMSEASHKIIDAVTLMSAVGG